MDEQLIQKHFLVPKQVKLSEEEKKQFLEERKLSIKQLPMIKLVDPGIQHLSPEIGDVIKIIRSSETVGESEFFRVVISG